jgi:hypothetical protein
MIGRWKSHLYRSKHYNYNWKFDNALRNYPVNSWTHEILLNYITIKIVHQKEIDLIPKFNTFKMVIILNLVVKEKNFLKKQ